MISTARKCNTLREPRNFLTPKKVSPTSLQKKNKNKKFSSSSQLQSCHQEGKLTHDFSATEEIVCRLGQNFRNAKDVHLTPAKQPRKYFLINGRNITLENKYNCKALRSVFLSSFHITISVEYLSIYFMDSIIGEN